MRVENTPTHHRREHNLPETTQVSFLAKFKAISNKLGQKRHPPQCSKDILRSAIYYKIQTTHLKHAKFKTCPLESKNLKTIKTWSHKSLEGKKIMKQSVFTLHFWLIKFRGINNDKNDNGNNNTYTR